MSVNRLLLQYAAPCARELSRNHVMLKKDYTLFTNALKMNREFPSERFRIYFPMVCRDIDPEKAGDGEVRDYFFGAHNRTHPENCRVFEAEVVEISGKAVVKKENGERLRADIYTKKRPRIGQKVVYHKDGIVDLL